MPPTLPPSGLSYTTLVPGSAHQFSGCTLLWPPIYKKRSIMICKGSPEVVYNSSEEFQISKRQRFCVQPVHLAAHLLDPNAQGKQLSPSSTHAALNFIFNWTQKLPMVDNAKVQIQQGAYSQYSSCLLSPVLKLSQEVPHPVHLLVNLEVCFHKIFPVFKVDRLPNVIEIAKAG